MASQSTIGMWHGLPCPMLAADQLHMAAKLCCSYSSHGRVVLARASACCALAPHVKWRTWCSSTGTKSCCCCCQSHVTCAHDANTLKTISTPDWSLGACLLLSALRRLEKATQHHCGFFARILSTLKPTFKSLQQTFLMPSARRKQTGLTVRKHRLAEAGTPLSELDRREMSHRVSAKWICESQRCLNPGEQCDANGMTDSR